MSAKQNQIIIYTNPSCYYCTLAIDLLQKKGQDIQEIDVAAEPNLRDEMVQKSSGRRTTPQIFINGTHVGGYDDLNALDQAGKLDDMLGL